MFSKGSTQGQTITFHFLDFACFGVLLALPAKYSLLFKLFQLPMCRRQFPERGGANPQPNYPGRIERGKKHVSLSGAIVWNQISAVFVRRRSMRRRLLPTLPRATR